MTPKNFFTINPILAAIHLFIWLLWSPSVWQTRVVETIAPTLSGDFALMNLSATQWRQPTVWRLLIIVYLVGPLFVGTIVGLVSMLISQDWVLALRGIIYVVTLSLVGGLVSGLLVSVGFSLVATTIGSLLVGLLFYFKQQPWYDASAILAGLFALSVASRVLLNLTVEAVPKIGNWLVVSILATGTLAVSAIIVFIILWVLMSQGLFNYDSDPEIITMIGLTFGIGVLLGLATQRWFLSWMVALGFIASTIFLLIHLPPAEETMTLTTTLIKPLIGGAQNGLLLSLSFATPYLLLTRFLLKSAAILAGVLSSSLWYVGIFMWRHSEEAEYFFLSSLLVIGLGIFPWWRWKDLLLAWWLGQRQKIPPAPFHNPYITGVPLLGRNKNLFVGRREIVTRIDQILRTQPSPPILLYGQRRLGKTSLLNALAYLLSKDYLSLLIDLQGTCAFVTDHSSFFYSLSRAMIKSAQNYNLSLPALSREAWQDSPERVFDDWLESLEVFCNDRMLLLVFDEYEALENLFSKGYLDRNRVLSLFRYIIQHRPRFKVILIGVCQLEEFPQWTDYLINAETIHLSYLQPPEARQLIQTPVAEWLDYTPEAIDYILALTRGHPALVQVLGKEIVLAKNSLLTTLTWLRSPVKKTEVEEVIPQVLKHWKNYFHAITQRSPPEQLVLQWLAHQGEGAIVSEEHLAKQFGQEGVKEILSRLIHSELIELTPQGYRFQVELMRRWLVS